MLSTYAIIDDVLGLKNLIDEYVDTRKQYSRRTEAPLVNLYENGDHLTITALAPGTRIEDIHLELVDSTLQLTIKRINDIGEAPCIRRERSTGTFSKSVRIPFRVNPDKISATLKDGILTVELEKSEDAKPKRITIN